MAHFAEIDGDNIVLRVFVVHNDDEHRGQEFLADDLGLGGTWIQCSYNTHGGVHYTPNNRTAEEQREPEPAEGYRVPDGGIPVRYNYASIGDTYDADNDAFYTPQPYPSWALDAGFTWQPPTPLPDDGNPYFWDEATTSWVEVGT